MTDTTDETMTCEGCAFWRQDGQDGQCKRHAPRAVLLIDPGEDASAVTVWPWTEPNDWCGDWKQRPTKARGGVGRMEVTEKRTMPPASDKRQFR